MTSKKQYDISYEQCLKMIADDSVCSRCGRKVVPLETVNNAGVPTFWSGCYHGEVDRDPRGDVWGHFDSGVRREIFDLAELLVRKGVSIASHYRRKESYISKSERLYWFQEEVSSVCNLLEMIEHVKRAPESVISKEEFLNNDIGWGRK